jgi:hypothetical protein
MGSVKMQYAPLMQYENVLTKKIIQMDRRVDLGARYFAPLFGTV